MCFFGVYARRRYAPRLILVTRMSHKAGQSISRDLARIIRDSSLLESLDAPLSRHLQAVEDRRAQGLEFYLRACALRLNEDGEGGGAAAMIRQ